MNSSIQMLLAGAVQVDSHTPLSTLLNQTHSKYHHQPEPTLPELLATYLAQQGFPTAKDAKAFAEIYFSNSSETTFLNRIPANLSQATVSKCARWVAKRAPKIIKVKSALPTLDRPHQLFSRPPDPLQSVPCKESLCMSSLLSHTSLTLSMAGELDVLLVMLLHRC